jgi:hypothetical protein
MSKYLQPNFSSQWLLIQTFGSIIIAIAIQSFATLIILLFHCDNLLLTCVIRLLGCLLSNAIQGYLQWLILKQFIKKLDYHWIYTSIIRLPLNILTWGLIHQGLKKFELDEDGTVLMILAIIGAISGAIDGRIIGNWQKTLFKKSLYWRSLWHDWDREHLLAGALGGMVASVTTIGMVILSGWNWISLPLPVFFCSIALSSISQVMYGLIIGDTIHDVFRQAKLLE